MIGGFLTRVSIMILGYAYPAYECYKTVELNKPEIEQLLFWCQYWILVSVLAVFERVGDALISWLPLYGEVKLAFFVYLWHPKTKGTKYIYSTFFQPYMSKHEEKIDRYLLELRSRGADLASRYWQKALRNGRSCFFQIFQYVVSQPSITTAHPVEEVKHATAAPPNETEQTSTSHQLKKKPDQADIEDSPISPSSIRSITTTSVITTPHNDILTTTTNNHYSFPHPQDIKHEEPMRILRRPRIKKRVATTPTSFH